MNLFEYADYKEFVLDLVSQTKLLGRGPYARLAEHLNVNSTFISQVFKGDKHLSIDHALQIAKLLKFNNLQTEYFMNLVQKERSASYETKDFFASRLKNLQKEAKKLSNYVSDHQVLDSIDQAIFYSDPIYSQVRLLTGIKKYQSAKAISEHLQKPLAEIKDVLDFLVSAGLCVKKQNQFEMGAKSTHVSKDSPFFRQHHSNWHIKAIENFSTSDERHLHFTAPLSIAKKDIPEVLDSLKAAIQNVSATVKDSNEEEVHCLLIDFFEA